MYGYSSGSDRFDHEIHKRLLPVTSLVVRRIESYMVRACLALWDCPAVTTYDQARFESRMNQAEYGEACV